VLAVKGQDDFELRNGKSIAVQTGCQRSANNVKRADLSALSEGGDLSPLFDSVGKASGRSLKGCEIGAGGPQTNGKWSLGGRHPKGVLESPLERAVAPFQGCKPINSLTGGLRCASTSGYYLSTLRVDTRARISLSLSL
jgi:hypothetical protein